MAKTVVDELVTLLGMEISPSTRASIAAFSSAVNGIKTKVLAASAALTAAAGAISYYAQQANQASSDLKKFSDVTGLNSGVVQEMGFAAELAGGSFSGMMSDLKSLTESMNSPIPGEFNQGLFLMGINTKNANGEIKKTDQVLMEVSKRMQGMSAIEQSRWAEKLGVGEDTLLLLKKGPEAIAEYRKQAQDIPTIVSPEALANAQLFTIQLKKVSRIIGYVGQEAASVAGPAIKGIVDTFAVWLKANKEFIQQGLSNIITGVADGFMRFWSGIVQVKDALFSMFPALDNLDAKMINAQIIARLLAGALAIIAVAVAAATYPFILAAAGIAVLAVAAEDFFTFLEGGDSVIGRVMEKFPGFTALIKTLAEAFIFVGKIVGTVFVGALKGAWEVIKMILTGWDAIFSGIGAVLSAVGLKVPEITFGHNAATSPSAPAASGGARSSGTTEIKIEQNITGGNATGAAAETKRMTIDALQGLIPGAAAPVAG
jgi:hypothetical protein